MADADSALLSPGIVAKVSGGRALRGFRPVNDAKLQLELRNHEPVCVNDERLGEAKIALLRPPSAASADGDCAIRRTNKGSFYDSRWFARKGDSESFRASVTQKGWSLAAKIHASSALAKTDMEAIFSRKKHSLQDENQHESGGESELYVCESFYIPLYSFQIPRNQMLLSEAALQRALNVQTEPDAEDFFKSFGAFASEGEYILGGVFIKQKIVKLSEYASLDSLLQTNETATKFGLTGAHSNPWFSIDGNIDNAQESSAKSILNDQSSTSVMNLLESTYILGPNDAKDMPEFLEELRHDPEKSVAIIDKSIDDRSTLVGVWELLSKHADGEWAHGNLTPDDQTPLKLKAAAKVLCKWWLQKAKRFVSSLPQNIRAPLFDKTEWDQILIRNEAFLANIPNNQMRLEQQPRYNEDVQRLPKPCIPTGKKLPTHKGKNIAWEGPSKDTEEAQNNVARGTVWETLPSSIWEGVSSLTASNLRSLFSWSSSKGPSQRLSSKGDYDPSTYDINFHYFGDIIVDRELCGDSLLQATDTTIHGSASQSRFNLICARKYLDCLRHRVDSLNHEVKLPPKSTSHDDGYGTEPEDDEIYCQTPMENLMQIIQASDLPTQVAVCNLLLSQRSAFPFVFPVRTNEHQKTKKASDDEDVHSSVSSQGGQSSLRDHCKGENASDAYLFEYTQALSFVDVKLQNERKLCFADDVCLPRVVFVSDRKDGQSHSSIIASRVVQCNFMSQQLHCMMSTERCGIRDFTIIEVGAGFIKTDSSRYIECICINVFGAYENIIHFISQLGAEMLVVEIESANADKQITRLDTVCSELVRWRETGGKPGVNREAKLIWGSETYLVERITKIVYSKFKRSESSQNERYSLSEICSRHFQQGCTHAEATNEMRNCLRQMLEACDFKEMRKQLKLQDRFAYDPEELLPGLQIKEGNNNQEPNSQLRVRQLPLVKDVAGMPLMKLFYNILDQEKRELRMAGIMVLARGLYQMSSHALKDASAEVDRLHKECQKSTSRRAYYEAKHEYEKKHVGLENLWRELSIIYRADPVNQHRIPRLAAQHLLDGSPLEIIDGDAGVFSKFWVENVLQQLQTMASKSREKPARIFVMSVIGVQSSGKSTLLNLMFGTQLQTSAGRCTRGVYAQLVPSHREQYDYVLLLDIEGLRSPEFFQLDSNSSIVRDNCLATFGFLPSDVSVFMVSNEDDIGLREILPMVLLAFKGSEIAEKYGQKIRSKIVFVYRSIDTNDQGKIKGSKQKLSRYLKDAAREVGNLKGRLDCGTEDGEAPNYRRPGEEQNQPESPFEDSEVGLRLDFTSDDRYSDIKFFGNLKRGSNPPTDTPEWDYGENVLHLREYLHERVVDDKWEASTFEEWFKRLTMVWDCILTSNFEISFRTQMQYASYLELHEKMNLIKSKVSEMYCEDFKSFEMMVLGAPENASDIHYDASVRSLKLRDFVESQRQEVAKLFHTNKTYNEWKASVLAQWDLFCSQTDHWYQKRVDDLVNGEVKFKQVIEKYQLKCKEEIVNNYDARIWGTEQINSEQMRERFEKLFEEIIRSAESEYRPISANIDKQISDYYKNKHLGDVLDSDRRSFSFFRSSKTVFDERLRQRLDFMIQDELKFEKQYSAPAVDRVIQRTKQILSEAGSKLGKDAKLSGHRWVYKKLIDAMTKIQNRWDEDHNVSKKLQSDEIKEGLQRFFEDVSQGLENSILLANQLERVLKTELKNTFELAVVKRVLRLISFSTLTNQDVIRKVLDYHLLRLCELKQDELVVSFVTLGSKHFTYMLERLVSHQMSETLMKQLWDNLVESLVQCLKEPPNGPTTDDGFISTLSFRLTEVIQDITGGDISLPIALRSIYVRNDHERTTDLSATDFYSKKLPKLCESLQQEPMPNVKDHLVGKVMKEVEVAVDESWRSRCGIRCPGCGSPCHLAKGHNDQKHDTIHQPAGLNGMRWKDEDTLVERSCSTMVNDEQILWYRGGSRPPIPYSDFCIHFPEWSKPMGIENNNFSKQVREFVFFNYQDQLVHWFMRGASGRTFQQAKNIPASYNHNPKELQDKLELLLRRNFAKKEDFNTFMDVLLS